MERYYVRRKDTHKTCPKHLCSGNFFYKPEKLPLFLFHLIYRWDVHERYNCIVGKNQRTINPYRRFQLHSIISSYFLLSNIYELELTTAFQPVQLFRNNTRNTLSIVYPVINFSSKTQRFPGQKKSTSPIFSRATFSPPFTRLIVGLGD